MILSRGYLLWWTTKNYLLLIHNLKFFNNFGFVVISCTTVIELKRVVRLQFNCSQRVIGSERLVCSHVNCIQIAAVAVEMRSACREPKVGNSRYFFKCNES